jgi:hypothetical protein
MVKPSSKMVFESSHFTLVKIVTMWHFVDNAIQHALPYAFGQKVSKPPYKYHKIGDWSKHPYESFRVLNVKCIFNDYKWSNFTSRKTPKM